MQVFPHVNAITAIEFFLFKRKGTLLFLFFSLFLASCEKELKPSEEAAVNDNFASKQKKTGDATATVTVFATGLNNPRGLEFGPDGYLYVAEAGLGGSSSTVAICPDLQVAPPFGPFMGSATGGSITKIDPQGNTTLVTDQLPTSISGMGDIQGVSDVAFIGNTLYALLAGAGCSHGVATVPNGIVKINSNGTFSVVADLGTWQRSHPVANPADDFEPEGTWYSMVVKGGAFYAIDPNHGELVKVTTGGQISRVIDFSASLGHIVPTAMDVHGNFYVGNLGVFPLTAGSSSVYKVNEAGKYKLDATGFTAILGIAFDNRARMYVLENTTANPFPTPGTGRIVRVNPNGTQEVIATGLSLPTGMTFGPDGNLYVSNWGFGGGAGMGEILKVTLPK